MNPLPFFHPVRTTMASPFLIIPRFLAYSVPCVTRAFTSSNQSDKTPAKHQKSYPVSSKSQIIKGHYFEILPAPFYLHIELVEFLGRDGIDEQPEHPESRQSKSQKICRKSLLFDWAELNQLNRISVILNEKP